MNETATQEQEKSAVALPSGNRVSRWRWRKIGVLLLLLTGLLVGVRAALPWAIRWYVNRTLDSTIAYQGKIGDIELHLLKGFYSIHDVRLLKRAGNVPVPLFSAKRVDLAMQWDAIFHRKLVGQVIMAEPTLNFVDAPSDADGQSGAGGPWLEIIRGLFPFQINSVRIQNGSVHFRTYTKARPVDVYLSQLDASVDDLTNIHNTITPLVTSVAATAMAMDQGKFEFKMKLDPFSYRPTFHLAVRLLGLDVTKTNDLVRAYGGFDFKSGWFDFITEIDAKEGQLDGYVKPLFRSLQVFSLTQDVKQDDVLQVFWQALVGLTSAALTNHQRDQFGTVVPFTGSLDAPQANVLGAIGNVLRNAFIRAYLPKLQSGQNGVDELQFGAPSFADPISVGGQQ